MRPRSESWATPALSSHGERGGRELMSRSDQQEGGDPAQTEAMEAPEATVLLGAKLNTRDRKMALVHGNIEAFGDTDKNGFSDMCAFTSWSGVDCGHSGRWEVG